LGWSGNKILPKLAIEPEPSIVPATFKMILEGTVSVSPVLRVKVAPWGMVHLAAVHFEVPPANCSALQPA
jgi:hypothetical protein